MVVRCSVQNTRNRNEQNECLESSRKCMRPQAFVRQRHFPHELCAGRLEGMERAFQEPGKALKNSDRFSCRSCMLSHEKMQNGVFCRRTGGMQLYRSVQRGMLYEFHSAEMQHGIDGYCNRVKKRQHIDQYDVCSRRSRASYEERIWEGIYIIYYI